MAFAPALTLWCISDPTILRGGVESLSPTENSKISSWQNSTWTPHVQRRHIADALPYIVFPWLLSGVTTSHIVCKSQYILIVVWVSRLPLCPSARDQIHYTLWIWAWAIETGEWHKLHDIAIAPPFVSQYKWYFVAPSDLQLLACVVVYEILTPFWHMSRPTRLDASVQCLSFRFGTLCDTPSSTTAVKFTTLPTHSWISGQMLRNIPIRDPADSLLLTSVAPTPTVPHSHLINILTQNSCYHLPYSYQLRTGVIGYHSQSSICAFVYHYLYNWARAPCYIAIHSLITMGAPDTYRGSRFLAIRVALLTPLLYSGYKEHAKLSRCTAALTRTMSICLHTPAGQLWGPLS